MDIREEKRRLTDPHSYTIDNDDICLPVHKLLDKIQNREIIYAKDIKIKSGLNKLSEVLPKCNLLKSIYFIHVNFLEDGAVDLSKALTQCVNLQHLSFSFPSMTHENKLEVIKALPQLAQLSTLRFEGDNFSSKDAAALSMVLPQCTELKELYFWLVGMREDGFIKISRVLPQIPKLNYLSVLGCSIYSTFDEGAIELAKALVQGTQLTKLEFVGNKISIEVYNILVYVLSKTNIYSVELSCCGFRPVTSDDIEFIMKNNRARLMRAKFVVECFYDDAIVKRLSDYNNIISKEEFMDFRFWQRNNSFWVDKLGTNYNSIKTKLTGKINNYINDNYLQITEVVKDAKSMKKNNNINVTSLHDLPPQLLNKIFSYLELQDVAL